VVVNRLLRAFGVGGPTVRTELTTASAQPGGTYTGTVEVTGGDRAVSIGYIALVLLTRAGVQGGTAGSESRVEFHRQQVVDGFALPARERRTFEVSCDVPFEAPLTRAFRQPLAGMEVSLRTELEVAFAVDRSDLDPVEVTALPSQQHILDALVRLGFQFVKAEVEKGRLSRLPQTLPFYQELSFLPGAAYAPHVRQLDVSFVATGSKLHVVMELDRKVGPLADRDIFGRFTVDPVTMKDTDWRGLIDDWLKQSTTRRGPLR
jgi:sporulation-control protein